MKNHTRSQELSHGSASSRAARQDKASVIVIHRRLWLPGWPQEEAAPVAVSYDWKHIFCDVLIRARAFAMGLPCSPAWGPRTARPTRVDILAPTVPSADYVHTYERVFDSTRRFDMRCIEWSGGPFPTGAEVLVFWQPRKLFPALKVEECAQRLLDIGFGGGAVFSADQLAKAVESSIADAPPTSPELPRCVAYELLRSRAELINQARAIYVRSARENRTFTARETATYNGIVGLAGELQRQIEEILSRESGRPAASPSVQTADAPEVLPRDAEDQDDQPGTADWWQRE